MNILGSSPKTQDNARTLIFEELPSMLTAYPSFLRPRDGIEEGGDLPDLRVKLKGLSLDRQKIQDYREVCGLPDPEDYSVPMLYPQVLAGPLHAQVFAHPEFPLPAMGLIHIANTITEHRKIMLYEPLDFEIEVQGVRPARKGHEFDLFTYAFADDELVWEATTTILSPVRGRSKSTSSSKKKTRRSQHDDAPAPWDRSVAVHVPPDQGRQYSSVSGDHNPIHITKWTAKPFGFKRAIVHGMWSLGRALAEVIDDLPERPRLLEVGFKRPIYLPSTIAIHSRTVDDVVDVEVRSPDGDTLHMVMSVRPDEADTSERPRPEGHEEE